MYRVIYIYVCVCVCVCVSKEPYINIVIADMVLGAASTQKEKNRKISQFSSVPIGNSIR